MERVPGFEPRTSTWKDDALPLRHTRLCELHSGIEPAFPHNGGRASINTLERLTFSTDLSPITMVPHFPVWPSNLVGRLLLLYSTPYGFRSRCSTLKGSRASQYTDGACVFRCRLCGLCPAARLGTTSGQVAPSGRVEHPMKGSQPLSQIRWRG